MIRGLLGCAFAALVFATPAFADGGTTGVTQGWDGVATPDGSSRYVTIAGATDTALALIRTRGGRVQRFISIPGSWGIPTVTVNGTGGGLSADGHTLVLGDASPQTTPLRAQSTFLVLDAKTLQTREFVRLKGDFAYDALAPDARTLYLIQHVSMSDLSRYVVRAYDLWSDRLAPGAIADRTQRGWVMQGYPIARATTPGARIVYTLYTNAGGFPFIHALDTANATAHCIGVPWRGNQNRMWELRLSLRDGGRSLALVWPRGRTFISVDTTTYRLARPATAGGEFPWWAVAVGGSILLAAVGGGVVRRGKNT
jgi:hypothetical protein